LEATFVLVHSPLVGPLTWSLVAAELRERNTKTLLSKLNDEGGGDRPYWHRHAESATRGTEALGPEAAIVLVGHSGAGPLLPAIRERIAHRVVGYVFVDAGFPLDGRSRLELMDEEDAEFARQLREHLTVGGRFPTWSEEDLGTVLPNARLRRALVEELRPRDLAFFSEPIPVFAGWPDAAYGYLRLSAAYDGPFRRARATGWPCRELDGGHFQMLVEPATVATAILALVEEMGVAV
jgi:hypothetical protein